MVCTICQTELPEGSRYCLTCGADLSDPETSTRRRALSRELLETLRKAVEGHYRVTEMIGRGGMGAVFLAEDIRLGRMVAIKVLRPELADEPTFTGRFDREARIAAGLDHPGIIPIYAVEQVEDFHYFVMKYVRGRSLEDLLAAGPLPVDQAREILNQAAAALGHAHSRGVVHRDVKPSNIMLDEQGRVLVMDFGISKALESNTQYTSTGQIVGTPRYVSPEQAMGEPLDGRSDQYSLGVVGYQMLTGRLPLVADSVAGLMYKHVHEVPPTVRALRPEVPLELSDPLMRALAKRPDQRFPSMEEFAAALLSTPRQHTGPASGDDETLALAATGRTPARRSFGLRLALGAAALALIAGMAVLMPMRQSDPPQAPSVPSDPASSSEVQRAPSSPGATPTPRLPADSMAVVTASPAAALPDSGAVAANPRPPASRKPSSRPAPVRRDSARVASAPVAPLPPSAAVGFLTVNAIPYGTVSIDGVEIGDTPIVRRELSPGDHTLRIVRDGFRTEVVKVPITTGNEVRLSRTLVKEGQ